VLARDRRARARAADQRRADAVGARDRDAGLHDAGDVERELVKLRALRLRRRAGEGLRVGSAGTHPFSLFERQRITAKDRYHALIDQLQYVAAAELIFGMHVHVAVDDPDKAIQVVNGLLPTCARCSRFRRARRSGAASRPASPRAARWVFSASRAPGRPPRFRDYEDYAEVVGQLERTAASPTTRTLVGHPPTPQWGTIEVHLRRRHAPRDASRSRVLPGARQAAVRALRRGEEIPSYHRILTTENKWLAARYGSTRR
jgi:carboxylate-amine ligase